MVKGELVSFIHEAFHEQEETHGYTNPKAVARAITGGPHSHLFSEVERSVLRMDTRDFLYEGAEETLRGLLATGDTVVIWTNGHEQGQLFKAAKTGLRKLRNELPFGERRRFSVFASQDKILALPNLLSRLQLQGIERVVIVDDKASNMVKTSRVIETTREQGELSVYVGLVWINQGRTKNQVPQGYSLEKFQDAYTTVEDIRQLRELKAEDPRRTAWLIDLDHTLIDTEAAKERMFKQLAETIESHIPSPVVSHPVDLQLGLDGNVRDIEELLSGMSGGRVIKVGLSDRSPLVIKHNPNTPERIRREIEGYQILLSTPLAEYLLPPTFTSEDDAVIALPYFDGVQLRQGIQKEVIQGELAKSAVSKLLSLKQLWWSSQEKMSPNGDLMSMQRQEWKDTVDRIHGVLEELSERFKIPIEHLWKAPLVFEGAEYPPLYVTMAKVAHTLETPPPYAILAHADATGANLLVSLKDGKWKLTDAEWSGPNDPAEAFVRMVKYISTTTVKEVPRVGAEFRDGKIHVDLELVFPEIAVILQNLGLSATDAFTVSLSDPDFKERVKAYLAGSYIRELALASKRGYPELGLFAMLKAAEAISP